MLCPVMMGSERRKQKGLKFFLYKTSDSQTGERCTVAGTLLNSDTSLRTEGSSLHTQMCPFGRPRITEWTPEVT